MNAADGPPCLLWRRGEPLPDADEDACWIGSELAKHLRETPIVCDVESNQEPRSELTARDGRTVRPGSLFRWWYGLPWSYERAGVRVINPNCLWVAVRDKFECYRTLRDASSFRVPQAFPVERIDDVPPLLEQHRELFRHGFVLKPRVGWGGAGVQVANLIDPPRYFAGNYLLSERIIPPDCDEGFWDVRVFVMAGEFLGGVRYSSRQPVTNFWRGGQPGPLDINTRDRLEPAAIEAVRLLDEAADTVHHQPAPCDSPLTRVVY
jgi:glutathione synthase/RimK-type ligase-like ATP-grasp enzyme